MDILDPKKEANVDASSSDYTIDAINHNTSNEPVIVDDTRQWVAMRIIYAHSNTICCLDKLHILLVYKWRGYLQRI